MKLFFILIITIAISYLAAEICHHTIIYQHNTFWDIIHIIFNYKYAELRVAICTCQISNPLPSPCSLVGSVYDLRKRGRWFDPRLGQYSFRGFMIDTTTGFIPLSPLSVTVSTMVMWESSLWLRKNIVRSNSKN